MQVLSDEDMRYVLNHRRFMQLCPAPIKEHSYWSITIRGAHDEERFVGVMPLCFLKARDALKELDARDVPATVAEPRRQRRGR